MKIKAIYLIACLAILSTFGCGDNKDENETKLFHREFVIDGHESDTVFTVPEFTSVIEDIKNDSDWLLTEILDSNGTINIKVICTKNNTTAFRSTIITVVCKNGDTLTITVKQDILDDFDDIHNNQSDKPALAPLRQ